MLKSLFWFAVQIIRIWCVSAHNEMPPDDIFKEVPLQLENYPEPDYQDLNDAMEKFELKVLQATKTENEGIVPPEETEVIYDEMCLVLEDLTDLMTNNPNNAYAFLKRKGVDRIILPNLSIAYPHLRNHLLSLTKVLFDIAPVSTKAMTPNFMVDKLLDIYETSDVGLKNHVLDILMMWLPDNPKLQTRIVKFKGMNVFYSQLDKLDAYGIHSLLELFNTILLEHLIARDELSAQKSKADFDKFYLYQRIGLIEHVSTPAVCKGLLNMFASAWPAVMKDDEVVIPMLEIIKNTKEYCLYNYIGRKSGNKAVGLFENLLKYIVDNKDKWDSVLAVNVNVTEYEPVLQDYIEQLKPPVAVKEDL